MPRLGTDASITECRQSGYPVMEYHATKAGLDPKKEYKLTISDPAGWSNGTPVRNRKHYAYFGYISYQEMWEAFEEAGDGIKDFCDFAKCPLPSPEDSPDYQDFVTLAGIVFAYCGLPNNKTV